MTQSWIFLGSITPVFQKSLYAETFLLDVVEAMVQFFQDYLLNRKYKRTSFFVRKIFFKL